MIVVPSVLYRTAPTDNSVVKLVPEPVTVALAVDVVILPVNVPDIHVLTAFQLPVALDVSVICPLAVELIRVNEMPTNSNSQHFFCKESVTHLCMGIIL